MEALLLRVAQRFMALPPGAPPDDAIERALRDVTELLGVEQAYLMQLDPDGDTLSITHGLDRRAQTWPFRVSMPTGSLQEWLDGLSEGKAHGVRDLDTAEVPEALVHCLRTCGIQSTLAAPMLAGEKLLGWLGLGADAPRQWTPADVTLARLVSQTIVHALRLHWEEREILLRDRRFQAFLDQNPDAMWVLELVPPLDVNAPEEEQIERILDSRIARCNGPAAAQHGVEPEALTGLSFGALFTKTFGEQSLSHLREDTRQFVRNGYQVRQDEIPRHTPDGQTRWIARAAHGVVQDGKLDTIWTSSRDVTDKVCAREQAEIFAQRRQQAERLESIGLLAGGVAHDFNNLLMAILGNAELAALDPALPQRASDALAEIRRAGQRATELTRHLLAFSRNQPTDVKPMELNGLVHSMLRMLRRLLPESIELDFEPDEELGAVLADEAKMEQVILNLTVNARDAMEHHGRLKIETRSIRLDEAFCEKHPGAQPGNHAVLSVSDTGHGIGPDELPHVFEPFYTTKSTGQGTGLGLATVYGIVQDHGGVITVDSEIGRGTTFAVYLPATTHLESKPPERLASMPPGGRETVLLAEDEDQVRDVTTRMLERAGYTVVPVVDGNAAVEAFSAEPQRFDLVLLDVVMPGLNGRQVEARIRRLRDDIPVLFSSGYTGSVLSDLEVQELGDSLLSKPYDPDELLRLVRRALDGATDAPGRNRS